MAQAVGSDERVGDKQLRKRPDDFLRHRVFPQRRQRIIDFRGKAHMLIGEGITLTEQNTSQ